MKRITYTKKKGIVLIYVDGQEVAGFRDSTELEGEAHLRAFILGLRWGRNDEFHPVAKQIKSH